MCIGFSRSGMRNVVATDAVAAGKNINKKRTNITNFGATFTFKPIPPEAIKSE